MQMIFNVIIQTEYHKPAGSIMQLQVINSNTLQKKKTFSIQLFYNLNRLSQHVSENAVAGSLYNYKAIRN